MPRSTRSRTAASESEEENTDYTSKSLLETILKEVRSIKKQNDSFREETKKELEEIRTKLQVRDDKWDNDKTNTKRNKSN